MMYAAKVAGAVLGVAAAWRAANFVIDTTLGFSRALFSKARVSRRSAKHEVKKTVRRMRRSAVATA